jgi:hypothetical protein
LAGGWEILVLFSGIADAGLVSGVVWLAYLAIEPYARRHWPDSLISWNRILSGRFRDPLVASHVLAGLLAFFAADFIIDLVYAAVSGPPLAPYAPRMASLNSPAHFAARLLNAVGTAPLEGMIILVLAMLLRLLLRRVWIADLLTSVLLSLGGGALDFSNPSHFAATAAAYVLSNYAFLWLLRRFGFLAVMAMALMTNLAGNTVPYTSSLTSWYAGRMLVGIAIQLAIGAWALWVILSAKRVTQSAPA